MNDILATKKSCETLFLSINIYFLFCKQQQHVSFMGDPKKENTN